MTQKAGNRTYLLLLLVAFVFTGAAAAGAETNLLENPGFESPGNDRMPSGWQVVPHHRRKGEAAMDDQVRRNGRFSLKLSPNGNNDKEGFAVFQPIAADRVRGRTVTISGFVRAEGIGKQTIAINFKGARAHWLKLPGETGGEFAPFSQKVDIARSIPEALLMVFVSGDSGNVWLDDLNLSAPSPAQTPVRVSQGGPEAAALPYGGPVKLVDLPKTSEILFLSDRDTGQRRREIYAMDADGGNQTRITFSDRHHALIGADRSRRYIVASCIIEDTQRPKGLGHEDRRSLWVYDMRDRSARCLTDPKHYAEGDSFSPDGQWIVFLMKTGDKEQVDIYKIRRDGTALTRLTHTPQALEGDPSWSNDGRRIAFTRLDATQPHPRFVLKTMNTDGEDVRTLYDGGPGVEIEGAWPQGNYDPAWRHDDRWIVFERAMLANGANAGSGVWHIFKVSADGRTVVDLSQAGGHDDRAEYLPSFSPDGRSIVFSATFQKKGIIGKLSGGFIDIFTMNDQGGELRRLTDDNAQNLGAVWIHPAR